MLECFLAKLLLLRRWLISHFCSGLLFVTARLNTCVAKILDLVYLQCRPRRFNGFYSSFLPNYSPVCFKTDWQDSAHIFFKNSKFSYCIYVDFRWLREMWLLAPWIEHTHTKDIFCKNERAENVCELIMCNPFLTQMWWKLQKHSRSSDEQLKTRIA